MLSEKKVHSKEERRPIVIHTSRTPNLARDFAPYLDRGRLSLLERRKPNVYDSPTPIPLILNRNQPSVGRNKKETSKKRKIINKSQTK